MIPKVQYLRMNTEQKVMYVNALLRSGETLTSIAKKMSMARSSLQSSISVAGFVFERRTKQYVFNDELMTNPLTTTEIKERLNNIEEILKRYLSSENVQSYHVSNELISEIPSGNEIRVTIRINEKVWNKFNDFCNEKSNFYKKDLLTIALIEFMKNYQDKKNN